MIKLLKRHAPVWLMAIILDLALGSIYYKRISFFLAANDMLFAFFIIVLPCAYLLAVAGVFLVKRKLQKEYIVIFSIPIIYAFVSLVYLNIISNLSR